MGTKNLTIDEIKTFAELAQSSYQDWVPEGSKKEGNSEITIGDKTYTVVDVLNDEETGAYAFLAEDNQGNKYLAFRGTEKDGLNTDPRDIENDKHLVLGETPSQLESVQNWINSLAERGLIKPEDNVISVGHSLGGYLADAATFPTDKIVEKIYEDRRLILWE